jgi:hypothetical protein
MTDIVERLREMTRKAQVIEEHGTLSLAADEIERLRLNVFGLTADNAAKSDIIRELHDEIERLRAALEWIAEDDGGRAGDEARAALGEAKDE